MMRTLASITLLTFLTGCSFLALPTVVPNALVTSPAPTASPAPTSTSVPTVTATEASNVATVRVPFVNVRSTPGGTVVRQIEAGTEVTVLEIVTDDQGGEWVRIGEGEYIFKGCLSIADGRGCEAK